MHEAAASRITDSVTIRACVDPWGKACKHQVSMTLCLLCGAVSFHRQRDYVRGFGVQTDRAYFTWIGPSPRNSAVVVRILLGQLFVTTFLEEQWASNTCDSTWYVATLRSKYLRFVSGEAAQEDSLQLCILTES